MSRRTRQMMEERAAADAASAAAAAAAVAVGSSTVATAAASSSAPPPPVVCSAVTRTTSDQREVEARVAPMLAAAAARPMAAGFDLARDTHAFYLVRSLRRLSAGYACLDSSRPWLVYWIVHSLSLMDALDAMPADVRDNAIDFLARCQNDGGGFGGGPQQQAHLAPTYAAVCALATLGTERAYRVINRPRLYRFLLAMKQPNGGFSVTRGGEVDTRGGYCALAAASLAHVLTPQLCEGAAAYVRSCQTYEGGIGGEPGNEAHGGYTYCGLASMLLLGEAHQLALRPLLRWATARQMPIEGGFSGRSNKLVDGCYSFWVGGLFPLLELASQRHAAETGRSRPTAASTADGADWLFDRAALQRYILGCCQHTSGGLKDKPPKGPDLYHTCYCVSGLSTAQHAHHRSGDDATAVARGETTNAVAEGECIVGHADNNRLLKTNAVFNVETARLTRALTFFAALPPIVHDEVVRPGLGTAD